MSDSFATRMSKQLDQMIKERALKSKAERDAKLAAQQEQKQAQAPAQPIPQESRSTIEQIRQNKEATEKAAKDIEQY